ncbi:hypothetical protein F5883DRAFT_426506 [Diaporthe sp. PMI_573]|jgi:hypothetical protein|nr:hypothetical protein F5883DRAFT_426506 [Diaporthaceae sp. PMI_573]
MPPINQAAISAGVIAVSVAVAAAIAIYESPELQRMATDLRRRIAVALHSLGDGIGPEHANREPLFNRPEDAEGFLQSGEVDADDDSRKRQREELLYWNAVKLSQELEKQTAENEKIKEREKLSRSGTTFDDFLQEDETSNEKGTYVFNTGADVRNNDDGLLVRRRGAPEGVRGLNSSIYANPFADEHGIDYNDMEDSQIAPEKDEVLSTDDIYTASPRPADSSLSRTLSPATESLPELIPVEPPRVDELMSEVSQPEAASTPRDSASEAELGQDEYMTAGQADRGMAQDEHDAYASIQAWAEQQQQAQMQNQESSRDFYSPLPVTPAAPLSEMSEGEMVSEGQLTPTDSASVAGSGFDVANELASHNGSASKYYDVLSEDEDGIPTPAHSWTEVGSVVSESEDGHRPAVRS